jgi:pimeloyl-ACP methyl ester carboxylesterase
MTMDFTVSVGGPADGPAVVLLHGFPQNATMWAGVTPALHAAGLRTIAPDQRGYSPGARPSDADEYRMEKLVGDVLSIMDSHGVGRAHLVGHDWGSFVGWWLAAAHPDRLWTFTAVSVPHPQALATALRADAHQRELMSYVTLFRIPGKAERVLLDDDAVRLRRMFTRNGVGEGEAERYLAPMREPGALTGALNWYRATDFADPPEIEDIVVPTTYVWGEEDTAVGPAAAKECARHVRGEYRFVPLPGVGHWVLDQAPDAVAQAVLAGVER